MIGKPLVMDNLTGDMNRLTFARVCVQINNQYILPDFINIEVYGSAVKLKLVYDWKPSKCDNCSSINHTSTLCPDKIHNANIPEKNRGRSRSRNRLGNNITHNSKGPDVSSVYRVVDKNKKFVPDLVESAGPIKETHMEGLGVVNGEGLDHILTIIDNSIKEGNLEGMVDSNINRKYDNIIRNEKNEDVAKSSKIQIGFFKIDILDQIQEFSLGKSKGKRGKNYRQDKNSDYPSNSTSFSNSNIIAQKGSEKYISPNKYSLLEEDVNSINLVFHNQKALQNTGRNTRSKIGKKSISQASTST